MLNLVLGGVEKGVRAFCWVVVEAVAYRGYETKKKKKMQLVFLVSQSSKNAWVILYKKRLGLFSRTQRIKAIPAALIKWQSSCRR